MRSRFRQWHDLTWSGRCALIWYPIRALFVAPAPDDERCFMGAPISSDVWCPRRRRDGLWCKRHEENR